MRSLKFRLGFISLASIGLLLMLGMVIYYEYTSLVKASKATDTATSVSLVQIQTDMAHGAIRGGALNALHLAPDPKSTAEEKESIADGLNEHILGVKLMRSILLELGGGPSKVLKFETSVAAGDRHSEMDILDGDSNSITANLQIALNSIRSRDTDAARSNQETKRINIPLDNVATNVMIADNKRNIIYLNKSIGEMLANAVADLRKALASFSVQNLIGSNFDQFHKHPAHQKQCLASERF